MQALTVFIRGWLGPRDPGPDGAGGRWRSPRRPIRSPGLASSTTPANTTSAIAADPGGDGPTWRARRGQPAAGPGAARAAPREPDRRGSDRRRDAPWALSTRRRSRTAAGSTWWSGWARRCTSTASTAPPRHCWSRCSSRWACCRPRLGSRWSTGGARPWIATRRPGRRTSGSSVYDDISARLRLHLARYPDSSAASYWLPAAALARGDLDLAWDLAAGRLGAIDAGAGPRRRAAGRPRSPRHAGDHSRAREAARRRTGRRRRCRALRQRVGRSQGTVETLTLNAER